MFSFVVMWNLIIAQMGYSAWQDISMGLVGPRSWETVHACEFLGIFGVCMLVWVAAGQEVVMIDGEHLRVRRGIFGWGCPKPANWQR
jgi:hypothetical protein